jgi:hypothetical protein
MLRAIGRCGELFHTPAGAAYADIPVNNHRETWPIRSQRFRNWLRRCHYAATGEAASAASIRSVLDLLEARAQFDGPERAVHIRTAEHGGRIYLDLADEHWRAVEIGADGWRVISSPPVRFRRATGMLALPIPEPGGSIEALSSFLNLPSRNDFVLIVAWLLAALRCKGPYPLIAISGEQGSAKTSLCKFLRALVDPNVAPVRALSREERELMIAANNGHLLAFDNLSGLPSWLSDALCRLATGGSFAARRLYTDDEEVLFQAARPILLNGIEDCISRPDLGDRAIFLTLAPIADGDRRSEADLWREFEVTRPRILGALLDGVVHGLRANNQIEPNELPRMADFARWAATCETAFWRAGTFARAYADNRRAAIESIIEADPLASCVRTIMGERSSWSGSASDLMRLFAQKDQEDATISPPWARNPRALAGRLRRAQTFLRMLDIEIAFGREGRSGARTIRLSALAHNPSSVNRVHCEGEQKGGYRVNATA